MELKQHPLSAAFPSMSEADFQALKDDIDNEGQREPIIVLDGMVLDGWHRYRACIELGMTPKKFSFNTEDDPAAFVKSVNLHRRHLTETQRAEAVIACSEWAPPNRLKNKQAPVPTSVKTNAQMATEARVSESTIKNAKAAHKAGLGDAMKEGAITAKEGAKIARGEAADKKSKTPSAVAVPAASPQPGAGNAEDFGPDEAELAAQAAAEEADRAVLAKLLDSDDKLATAHAEIKRLNAVNAVLQQRVNGLTNEKAEAIRSAKAWQRKYNEAVKAAA